LPALLSFLRSMMHYMSRSGGPGYRVNVDKNYRENKKDKKKIILFQKTIA
jgi:hypothetical protein